ncbi:hypothetical protein [Bacillus sp. 3255]|uniref:hypothetical protein n=1 Tax=Bacillus sp. 3255 TaxID=2817904 RepID=UPI00286217C6|nr:hypothetical protein [Bacillus sp. 3255]MDR6885415.1 hypothetical protein [Bacillus sp. 3255]
MDVNVQFVQLDVVLSNNECPSLILVFDQYSRLIIGSELPLKDNIKEIMTRGSEDNVTS